MHQIIKRADLLKTDSVHGIFKGVIDIDLKNQSIIVNGQVIKFIEGEDPKILITLNTTLIMHFLIDNTSFTTKENLSKHLKV